MERLNKEILKKMKICSQTIKKIEKLNLDSKGVVDYFIKEKDIFTASAVIVNILNHKDLLKYTSYAVLRIINNYKNIPVKKLVNKILDSDNPEEMRKLALSAIRNINKNINPFDILDEKIDGKYRVNYAIGSFLYFLKFYAYNRINAAEECVVCAIEACDDIRKVKLEILECGLKLIK